MHIKVNKCLLILFDPFDQILSVFIIERAAKMCDASLKVRIWKSFSWTMKTYWILIDTTKDIANKRTNMALKMFILHVIIIRPNNFNCTRLMNESRHGLHSFYRLFKDLLLQNTCWLQTLREMDLCQNYFIHLTLFNAKSSLSDVTQCLTGWWANYIVYLHLPSLFTPS